MDLFFLKKISSTLMTYSEHKIFVPTWQKHSPVTELHLSPVTPAFKQSHFWHNGWLKYPGLQTEHLRPPKFSLHRHCPLATLHKELEVPVSSQLHFWQPMIGSKPKVPGAHWSHLSPITKGGQVHSPVTTSQWEQLHAVKLN